MITVILRRLSGHLTGFTVRGHSGYAERGSDIVCAGVSSLTQAAALGITRHLGIPATVRADGADLECHLPTDMPAEDRDRAEDAMEIMLLGVREIAGQYPGAVRVVEG